MAAGGASFGAEVDEVVGFGGEVHVVFDDDDGVTFIDEAVEDIDESGDVLLMESDGGLFDEVEVFRAGADFGEIDAAFDELSDELESLSFAPGEGGAGLAEGEVAKSGFG